MRMHPVIPIIQRTCTKDYQIPETDKVIETGTAVIIPLIAIQNDGRYFKNPEKFIPERYNDDDAIN